MRNNLNDTNSQIVHVAQQAKHIAVQDGVVNAKISLRDYLSRHEELASVFAPALAQWRPLPFTMALAQIIRNHSPRDTGGRYTQAKVRRPEKAK